MRAGEGRPIAVATAAELAHPYEVGDYRIVTARTSDQLDSVRAAWESLALPSHEHELDFFLTKLRARSTVVRPHVTLVERNGRPRAGALGWVEDAALECKFGYATVYRPSLRLLVVRPSVVFDEESEAVGRALMAQLLACLARGEADALSLYRVQTTSPFYAAARHLPRIVSRDAFVRTELRWTLRLPDSLESLLASRSRHARSELRRLDRRLTRKYLDRLDLRVLRAPADKARLLADVDHVAAKTYQRGLGVGFAPSLEQVQTIELALDRGWFRAYVLYVDGAPIAYRTGFVYRNTFFGSKTGFDPSYAGDRVGTFLLMRVIEDLCRDDAVATIDFGRGDEQYKRRFSTACSEEADLIVFAPTVKGIRMNIGRSIVLGADHVTQTLLRRSGFLTPLRRRWRDRLRRSVVL